ncbi:MAG: hypothetical protein ISS88_02620 [Candidatus Portnoybacteria bacterium]|nr:hypothetical protein [Candidatus Portnoybacteria bacterium]
MVRDFQFQRITEDQMIVSQKWYPIIVDSKNPQNIIFVGIKNGKHALFSANPNVNVEEYRSGNHRLFKRAPPGATHYSLDGTRKTVGGWKYELKWRRNA